MQYQSKSYLFLITCLLLLTHRTLNIECKNENQLTQGESEQYQIYLDMYNLDNEHPGFLEHLNEDQTTKGFFDPNDKNIYYRARISSGAYLETEKEYIDTALTFSEAESQIVDNTLRVTLKAYSALCVIQQDGNGFTVLARERPLDRLETAVDTDNQIFLELIKPFETRLRLYKNMSRAVLNLFAMDLKLCMHSPHFYHVIIPGYDFNNPTVVPSQDPIIVLFPLRFAVKYSKVCDHVNYRYDDHFEVEQHTCTYKKYQKRVEYFPLAFMMMYTETAFWSYYGDRIRDDELDQKLLGFGKSASTALKGMSYEDNPIENLSVGEIFKVVLDINQRWNTMEQHKASFGYGQFEYDIMYLGELCKMFYIKQLVKDIPNLTGQENAELRDNLRGSYNKFVDLMRGMVKSNDMNNGRPDSTKIETEFNLAIVTFLNYKAQAQALRRLILI